MAQNFALGHKIGLSLQKALGIDGAVQRIVIDCPCDDVVRVYVQYLMESEQMTALLDVLEKSSDPPQIIEANKIEIDEKGRVKAE